MQWMQQLLSWEWAKITSSLGVAGILTGLTKSLADHWIGQRKDRTTYRRSKLEEWRTVVHCTEWSELGDTPAYAEMRQYIAQKVISDIEHPRTVIFTSGRGNDARKQMLLDELARIERIWKLI